MVKFGYTILYVKDVAKTASFYVKAFGFEQRFISPDNSYSELVTGETTLSFASIDLAQSNLKDGFIISDPNQKPFAIEIGLTTDNVDETVKAAIEAGASLVAEPKTKPWGQIVAYIRDLDGFLIEICTPMA